MRVHEAATEKKLSTRRAPYAPKGRHFRSRAKDEFPFRPKFKMTYKELLAMPGLADKMSFPPKTDRNLGPRRDT